MICTNCKTQPIIKPLVGCKKTNPVDTDKKVIALLELTNSPASEQENLILQSINFYWFNDPSLPKFPVIDTQGTLQKTIEALTKYYNLGYRIFFGMNRSTILEGVLMWFEYHPDAIGISLTSAASSLAVPKNIYRMVTDISTILTVIPTQIENANNIYYIYTEGELITEDLLTVLQNNPTTASKLRTYPVSGSYNVSDIQTFFDTYSPSSDDIVLLGLFDTDNYIQLYNIGLTFPGTQYTLVGTIPLISSFLGTAGVELDNKYFYVESIFPNTSILWRKNLAALIQKYGSFVSSGNLINALIMIGRLKKKESIQTLASHLGVLEFNSVTKDLKYPSYIVLKYELSVNDYVKSYLTFVDPLLGPFSATFP